MTLFSRSDTPSGQKADGNERLGDSGAPGDKPGTTHTKPAKRGFFGLFGAGHMPSASDLQAQVKRLEAELRESRTRAQLQHRRLEQAADLAQLGYYVWDFVEQRCECCSPRMAAAFGLTVEEFCRKTANDPDQGRFLIYPDDREAMEEAYARLPEGKPRDIVYRTQKPGDMRWLHETATPVFDESGRMVKVLYAAIDITEQRERQAREAETKRLESLGRLSGGIAHDFNNLLAVILGNLELLQDTQPTAEQAKLVEEAISATNRGSDLTRNMLGFARADPDGQRRIDLNHAISDMQPLLRRSLPANIDLTFDLAPDLPSVEADRTLAGNALLNLVINARDAMPKGGRIDVGTRTIVTPAKGDNPARRIVVLTVSDTGRGIDPAIREDVFRPFFSTKSLATNNGLGLAEVRNFVKSLGGRVELESEPGRGTEFRLYFPAAEGVAPADGDDDGTEAPVPKLRPLRIMLAEDDAQVGDVLVAMLRSEGHHIVHVSDAAEALRRFDADGPFDLLLSDVVMPGAMRGPELVRKLHERQPELRTILISGYLPEESNAVAEKDGLPVLLKPVNRAALFTAIAEALAGSA
ncbi:ATP-binding protein [Pseudoruegeria sp. HB172150]|uniref:ATP-binding protein n=1 Tax=Pseudoruegeria sp. HB172150 TaxID=2721164 RepID=UPI001551CEB6